MSTMRYKLSSVLWAFFLALCLLFFGAENGLASISVRGMSLTYRLVADGSYVSDGYKLYYYFLSGQDAPSVYEAWPFLQDLQHIYQTANGLHTWYPYGYLAPGYGNDPPYVYLHFDTYFTAGNVPDDWTQQDIDDLLNKSFNNLSPSQKAATTGTFISGVSNGEKFTHFNTKTIGASSNGGVVTYNEEGDVSVSYPDNTGYISGYKLQPDGSTTPVYYTLENNQVIEHDSIPVTDYSSLSYDSDIGHYSLDIPNYSRQLDIIINKMDSIKSDGAIIPNVTVNPSVTVPPPEITVNPPVVNVAAPEVTVNPTVTAPDVTVNVNTDLSSVNSALSDIKDALTSDNVSTSNVPGDLSLESDEVALVNSLRDWEIDIPLLGDAVDFGLNSLLGKIPSVGTEYVWMDYTLGSPNRSSRASPSRLEGYHVRIDLTPYRDTLLAVRGWLIILEALYFILLIYRNIREALQV